jgi:hypothetical protein
MRSVRSLTTEDSLVLGSLAVTLGGITLGAVLATPAAFGITALLVFVLLLAGQYVFGSARLAWLLAFGLVAGVVELWADWVHVTQLHSLVYTDYFGFRLLASPAYMAVAWCITVAQFGYLALRLVERLPVWLTVALLSLLGLSIPPWYEQLAAPAHAWHYVARGPMLSQTPLWVIGTYGVCMFAIASGALVFYRKRAWGRAILGGFFVGTALLFASVFWFSLLGH